MPSWTEEQKQVIEARDAGILVTAAAGAGKTTVLVARILSLLFDSRHPVDIDRLLVVTFTEAAAQEMKEKILLALEEKQNTMPGDARLRRQSLLVHNAHISTFHSFCLAVIRDHFQEIDLDPSFRTMENGEREILIKETMDTLLEDSYRGAGEDGEPLTFLPCPEAFEAFADAVETGKKQVRMEQAVRTLYNEAMGMADPEEYLEQCQRTLANENKAKEAGGGRLLHAAAERVRQILQEAAAAEAALSALCEAAAQPEKLTGFFRTESEALQAAAAAENTEALIAACTTLFSQKFPAVYAREKTDAYDESLKNRCQNCRNEIKKRVREGAQAVLYAPEAILREDLRQSGREAEVLIALTLEFMRRFEAVKRERNRIDFSDMEHLALRILTKTEDGRRVASPAAVGLKEAFAEIMVDEYQDTSYIQEAILSVIASPHTHNRFMVGDVKQSIYGFRQSRPDIFMEKYHAYSPEKSSSERRIDLHKNFRSRRGVIEAVNAVFEVLMQGGDGSIAYDETQRLVMGAAFPPLSDERVQVCLLDKTQKAEDENDKEQQARFVAKAIKKIKASCMVRDAESGQMRQARYGDVAILSRKDVGWFDTLSRALAAEDIPVSAQRKSGFFDTEEIRTLLDYLRILDNPLQDIPLAGTLLSLLGHFTAEDLAKIRAAYPQESFSRAAAHYRKEQTDVLAGRLAAFFARLDGYREKMCLLPIHRLLFEIANDLGYENTLLALEDGAAKVQNLHYLFAQAMRFEATGLSGVFHFLRYLEQLKERGEDPGEPANAQEAANTVRMMTIHKSKGLEFPIVLLIGLEGGFKKTGGSAADIYSPWHALAMDAVDVDRHCRQKTAAGYLIQEKKREEAAAEEIRLLYVAMTRAKEKLVLIGSLKEPQKEVDAQRFLMKQPALGRFFFRVPKSQLSLLLPVAAKRPDLFDLQVIEATEEAPPEDASPAAARRAALEQEARAIAALPLDTPFDAATEQNLCRLKKWRYPYAKDTETPLKRTVSEIKRQHEAASDNEAESLFQEPVPVPLIPRFIREGEKRTAPVFRGSAFHRFLELYDFTAQRDAGEEAALLEGKGLSAAMREALDFRALDRFLASPLAKRMGRAQQAGKLHREEMFVMSAHPEETEEEISLIQGVIDAFFEEDGRLVLVDYKTDAVYRKEELLRRYDIQLRCYRDALERLTHQTVAEMLIYSFALGSVIALPEKS